jgi:hypothetical protein
MLPLEEEIIRVSNSAAPGFTGLVAAKISFSAQFSHGHPSLHVFTSHSPLCVCPNFLALVKLLAVLGSELRASCLQGRCSHSFLTLLNLQLYWSKTHPNTMQFTVNFQLRKN